ncbi:hypothetical protein PInf_024760 [Phytophthora infestans]|nr:hypothetical protein PInf_024760 [Phytophthora infestans]
MNTSTITKGSLAFLAPPHAESMSVFQYVRVDRVDGAQVHVNIVDPGGPSDGEALEPIDLDVVKKRRVSDDEGKLLPGSYVGNPVAFIQPDGIDMDTCYAVVVGYHMNADAVLHLRYVAGARKLALQQPANVVKKAVPDEEDDQDKREVQRQNHILNAIGGGPIRHAEFGTYAVDEMRSNTTTTFRPTTIEKDIHDKIGHPDH